MANDCELAMNHRPRNHIRVIFPTDSDLWHGSASETLWAEPCDDGSRKIVNIPFLAFGISFGDFIRTRIVGDLIESFSRIVTQGGHSTYRIIIHNELIPEDRLVLINELGCLYEVASIGGVRLVSISVPPEVDIKMVYSNLELGESEGVWDFEESNFEH